MIINIDEERYSELYYNIDKGYEYCAAISDQTLECETNFHDLRERFIK